jgi:hypothetical protein
VVLKSAPEDVLREWNASSRVNKTGFGDDDPTIIDPDWPDFSEPLPVAGGDSQYGGKSWRLDRSDAAPQTD